MDNIMRHILYEKIKNISIELDEKKENQFIKFYDILTEWNQFMNLTSITEYDEVVEKHFLDSLSVVRCIDLKKQKNLIDIGTGAGFPGIPLKIVYPHLKVTLLDSLNKRVKFLNAVIDELNLDNINVIHGRAEDFAKKKEYREKYDLCISRAVANLSTLCEYCIPYINVGGKFISYKSGDIDEEILKSKKAISILGGEISDIIKFQLPGTDIRRAFIKIEKVKSTTEKYPRKAGIPGKEPL